MRTRLLITTLVAMLAQLFAGCAQLPPRILAPPTQALEHFETTPLGQIALENLKGAEGKSGFQLMPVASNAYLTRIALCERATKTLDVQYYLLRADATGRGLLRCLQEAALRGVRVRLLVDDYYTAGEDPILKGFAATQNVEVRLFNPFPAWRNSSAGRFLVSAADFGRIDHRMHNKLFIADNAMAVAGGRNMADEYFMQSAESNFVDMDILALGPIVQQLSAIFDTYWNSNVVYSLDQIVPGDVLKISAQDLAQASAGAVGPVAETPVDPRLAPFVGTPEDIASGKLRLIFAPARAFADPVDKVEGKYSVSRVGTVRDQLARAMRSADESVTVLSPYFVPGPLGMEAMEMLRARGVKLTLITNSLASTDEPLAHGAYTDSRIPMLRLGVNIYEISPKLTERSHKLRGYSHSAGRLHAKVAIIDHHKLFIGSMNLDERSERLNTELGVFIDSAELVEQFEERSALRDEAYQLELGPDGRSIRWIQGRGDSATILESEPETDFWLRLKVWILSGFVPPSEL
jgi:phosphatidylserine/phosphatidylglycerophosphate/cardiolipin synthase-like enzyme